VSLHDELRVLVEDAVRKVVREELSQAHRAPGPDDPFLSVADAAALVSVTPGTIRAWVKAGKLARYGAGRVLRVRRSELLSLLLGAASSSSGDDLSPEALADRDHARERRAGRRRRGRSDPANDAE
jgi:excisionase family DNA binding protein